MGIARWSPGENTDVVCSRTETKDGKSREEQNEMRSRQEFGFYSTYDGKLSGDLKIVGSFS